MEQWQRDHIIDNLPDLVNITKCNVDFLAILRQQKMLTENEEQLLTLPSLSSSEKSRKLYDILFSKHESYEHLKQALQKTQQSGAVKLLENYRENRHVHRPIKCDKSPVLGEGRFGTRVFQKNRQGRKLTVKGPNVNMIDLENVGHEVNILKNLAHGKMVGIHATEKCENCIRIALKLCQNNLEDQMKKDFSNDMQLVIILEEITKGLAYLHGKGVIHGDLKPENILFNEGGQAKIFNFGLSRQIPFGGDSVTVSSTFPPGDWMAPEILQYLDQVVEPYQQLNLTSKADIFSLGCIYYFVLTKGRHPFGEKSNVRHIRQNNILSGEKPCFAKTNIKDRRWQQVILHMMAHHQHIRPPAFEILLKDLFRSGSPFNRSADDVHEEICPTGRMYTFIKYYIQYYPLHFNPCSIRDYGKRILPPGTRNACVNVNELRMVPIRRHPPMSVFAQMRSEATERAKGGPVVQGFLIAGKIIIKCPYVIKGLKQCVKLIL